MGCPSLDIADTRAQLAEALADAFREQVDDPDGDLPVGVLARRLFGETALCEGPADQHIPYVLRLPCARTGERGRIALRKGLSAKQVTDAIADALATAWCLLKSVDPTGAIVDAIAVRLIFPPEPEPVAVDSEI